MKLCLYFGKTCNKGDFEIASISFRILRVRVKTKQAALYGHAVEKKIGRRKKETINMGITFHTSYLSAANLFGEVNFETCWRKTRPVTH